MATVNNSIGLRDRIRAIFSPLTADELATIRARAYEAGYADANTEEPGPTDGGTWGYRRTTTSHLRDFSSMAREDLLGTVWSLWQSSPVAKRIMTLKRDHIIGAGVKPTSEDPDTQTVLDDFWKYNKLTSRSTEFTLQLCMGKGVRWSSGHRLYRPGNG
jgi:hypothetical protein